VCIIICEGLEMSI